MPDKSKGFDQKSVSVYMGRRDQYIARAVEILAQREGMKESDLLKECFKEYCESIGIYKSPQKEGELGQWNRKKIERLEAKYGKQKKFKRLSKEVIQDEDDQN